jgi:hypothetical protein
MEHTGRISLYHKWLGLGQGERKRDPAGNPRTPTGSLSVAGGRGWVGVREKRDPAKNPHTPAGSLSVAGGRDWVGVREREIQPETHTHQSDLSLTQVVWVREREIRPKTHACQPDLSLRRRSRLGRGQER